MKFEGDLTIVDEVGVRTHQASGPLHSLSNLETP